MPDENAVATYRLAELEREVMSLIQANLPVRMSNQEKTTEKLEAAINKLTYAIVGFALTVAGSAVTIVFSFLGH